MLAMAVSECPVLIVWRAHTQHGGTLPERTQFQQMYTRKDCAIVQERAIYFRFCESKVQLADVRAHRQSLNAL